MKRNLFALALLGAFVTTGCSDLEHHDDLEFRGSDSDVEFWERKPNFAGNGDIEVHDGGGTDIPDCIIWNIDGAEVARQVEPGLFEARMSVDRNEITSNDGTQCSAFEEELPSGKTVYKLVDGEGNVALTLFKRKIYAGDFNTLSELKNKDNVAISFKKNQIFSGHWSNEEVLVSADAKIAKANPMRKLLLGALVTGECGSAGLP